MDEMIHISFMVNISLYMDYIICIVGSMSWSLDVYNLVGGSIVVVSAVQVNLFTVSNLDVLMTSDMCQICVLGMGIKCIFIYFVLELQ